MAAAGIVGFSGAAPKLHVNVDKDLERRLKERAKYEQMWTRDEYRAVAPGEGAAMDFLTQARPKKGAEVIDFGAGTGRGALMLALMGGCKVHMLDFAENCLDEDVRNALTTQAHALSFKLHDLNRPAPLQAQYGYCTDVMEHIPPEDVDRVLHNILRAAQHVYFQIACEDDKLGALIGEPLHLSVHDCKWWADKFRELDCIVHYSADYGTHCVFYLTAWQDGSALVDVGVLNIPESKVRENVRTNIAAGWQQVKPHATNDVEVMILGGGPSLTEHAHEIKAMREAGIKLITLNGAYNWAIEQGLTPSAQVMVDAREFNKRFTKPVVEGCKYLISSQCDPAALEGLPIDRTYLWHTSAESIRDLLNEQYQNEVWWGVPGGSTVMLRAIPLLRMLGFKKFHIFGFDSCLTEVSDTRDDKDDTALIHHAYSQPENDSECVIPMIVGGRVFQCHPWMATQAQEFMDLIKVMGDELELEVYGDGLISHILRTGAAIDSEQNAIIAE